MDDPTFLCERCLRNTHYESNDPEEENEEENADEAVSQEGTSEQIEKKEKYKKLFNFKAYHFSQI